MCCDVVQLNAKEYARFQESYGTILKVKIGAHCLFYRLTTATFVRQPSSSDQGELTNVTNDAGSHGCAEEEGKDQDKDCEKVEKALYVSNSVGPEDDVTESP